MDCGCCDKNRVSVASGGRCLMAVGSWVGLFDGKSNIIGSSFLDKGYWVSRRRVSCALLLVFILYNRWVGR